LPPLPFPRYYAASATLDGSLYVLGGIRYGHGQLAANERFDFASGSWATMAPMPEPAYAVAVAIHGGRIHVFSDHDHWEYEPAPADQWTVRPPVPVSINQLKHASAVTRGDRIYFVALGGALIEYDLTTETWTPRGSTPVSMTYTVSAMLGERMHVVDVRGHWHAAYDFASGTWALRASIPTSRNVVQGTWSPVAGGRLIVVDGDSRFSDVYDPATNSWERLAQGLAPERDATTSTGWCGSIYMSGGSTEGGGYNYFDQLIVE
jgi:hypothetical protein